MDKFFERFKPKSDKKKSDGQGGGGGGGTGLNLNFSLPGQKKFHGQGQSLGGSKPGIVISIQLDEAGPLGLTIEKRPNSMGSAIVAEVAPGSQSERAGLERGDILCFQGSDGEEEITYDHFLLLAKSNQRPLCFEIRRIPTKTTVVPAANGESAESFARKQAVIAAAEKREKEAKAWNKKTNPPEKKNSQTLLSLEERKKIEEERLARMDAAMANQSEAAREAVEAAKRKEAQTAAQLGYNPYETNRVTSGQARNVAINQSHGTIANQDSDNSAALPPLPTVPAPSDPARREDMIRPGKKIPVSHDFEVAYTTVLSTNDPNAVVSSFGILRKLIVNATTKGQVLDDEEASKFRRVRLGNPKIRAAIVDVEGAFDLMMAVGFTLIEEDGESFLVYPYGRSSENWLETALSMMEKYEETRH